jgi:hypothetical protein
MEHEPVSKAFCQGWEESEAKKLSHDEAHPKDFKERGKIYVQDCEPVSEVTVCPC